MPGGRGHRGLKVRLEAGSTGYVVLSEEAQQILRGQLDKDSTSPSVFPNPKAGTPYWRT